MNENANPNPLPQPVGSPATNRITDVSEPSNGNTVTPTPVPMRTISGLPDVRDLLAQTNKIVLIAVANKDQASGKFETTVLFAGDRTDGVRLAQIACDVAQKA